MASSRACTFHILPCVRKSIHREGKSRGLGRGRKSQGWVEGGWVVDGDGDGEGKAGTCCGGFHGRANSRHGALTGHLRARKPCTVRMRADKSPPQSQSFLRSTLSLPRRHFRSFFLCFFSFLFTHRAGGDFESERNDSRNAVESNVDRVLNCRHFRAKINI